MMKLISQDRLYWGKKLWVEDTLAVTDSKKVSDSIFLPTLNRLQLKSPRTIAFLWGRLIKLEKTSNRLQKHEVVNGGGL